ncbi:hypothetical protein OAN96_01130 [Candidatus Gracilibacteria bacterium]|nr:hypothetical protein [Candidatus Gracilibacteria bacterium]
MSKELSGKDFVSILVVTAASIFIPAFMWNIGFDKFLYLALIAVGAGYAVSGLKTRKEFSWSGAIFITISVVSAGYAELTTGLAVTGVLVFICLYALRFLNLEHKGIISILAALFFGCMLAGVSINITDAVEKVDGKSIKVERGFTF